MLHIKIMSIDKTNIEKLQDLYRIAVLTKYKISKLLALLKRTLENFEYSLK